MRQLSKEAYETYAQNGVWYDLDMVGGRDFIDMNPIKDLVAFYNCLSDKHPSETGEIEMFMDQFSHGRWYAFKEFCKKWRTKLNSCQNWMDLRDYDEMIMDGNRICGDVTFPLLYPYLAWKYMNDDNTDDKLTLDDFDAKMVEHVTPMGRHYLTERRMIR